MPENWYRETGEMQYERTLSSVGAHLCVRPASMVLVEYWIHEIPKKYSNVKIDYYVIMPDHLHLIILLNNERDEHAGSPLQKKDEVEAIKSRVPDIIKWFKTMTTNEYIRLVKDGKVKSFATHLWQRGYYDHVIRNRDDLKECRRYIKSNPKNTDY